MTTPDPAIGALAHERLADDEQRITGSRSGSRSRTQRLSAADAAFWRHPSPWLIGGFLLGAVAYRAALGPFAWTELVVPAALVALFPVIEWVIHIGILHWRPRRVGAVPIDSLLAFPGREAGATLLVALGSLMLGYERALPGAQRLTAPLTRLPGGVAQLPAAPLHERALLVHRHERGHGRPAARHLPRRCRRGHLTDRTPAARPRGRPLTSQAEALLS